MTRWSIALLLMGTLVGTSAGMAQGHGPGVEETQIIAVRVDSVYDGDTFTVTVYLSLCPAILCERVPVRVRGIDAPEIKGRCPEERRRAIAARDAVRRMLTGAKSVSLAEVGRDKFFRLLARVVVTGHDGRMTDLGADLIRAGHARPYDGKGPRQGWCGAGTP